MKGRTQLWLVPAMIAVILAGLIVAVSRADLDSVAERVLKPSYVADLTWEHVQLTLASTALVLAVALPLGILLSRRGLRWLTPPIVTLANLGQGAPAIGIIVLLAVEFGTKFWVAVLALAIYSALPALRNTVVGLQGINPRLIEAGRGIGMSAVAVLFRVELPLAVPVILAGIRTTIVLNVGVAALAAFIGAGGLGELVTTGVQTQREIVIATGGVLIALLALATDWIAGLAERYLHPKGL